MANLVPPAPAVIAHPTSDPRLERHPVSEPEHLFRERLGLARRPTPVGVRLYLGQHGRGGVSIGGLRCDVGAELYDDPRRLVPEAHGRVAADEAHAAGIVEVDV